MAGPSAPIRRFTADALQVEVYETPAQMGLAAAAAVAAQMRERIQATGRVRMIFAAAPSQDSLLAGLVAARGIDWSLVEAFHMDEYLGLGPDDPASFRRYLNEHLFRLVALRPGSSCLIPGESTDRPLSVCLEYESRLREAPIDIVCAGIGENGHLAFNDPPVADFLDPVDVKPVRLDGPCRLQQVHDGCFGQLEDVPTHAYTLTVPALLRADRMAVVVPGSRKAQAVLSTLRGPIRESCPASVLRTKAGAVLYLDAASASALG
jgi:glucosamine-6-phosphate deaminase